MADEDGAERHCDHTLRVSTGRHTFGVSHLLSDGLTCTSGDIISDIISDTISDVFF